MIMISRRLMLDWYLLSLNSDVPQVEILKAYRRLFIYDHSYIPMLLSLIIHSSLSMLHVLSHPLKSLKANPALLINIEESDLEADPIYGELTTAG